MDSDIAISLKGISKCYQIYNKPLDRLKQSIFRGSKNFYREFWALKNISFTVFKGETVGIIGKNGSGKSTMLQIIAGTLFPTMGEVSISGKVGALLELGSGFNPEFTGKENIYLNGAILGLGEEQIDAYYQDIVAFADIGDFVNQPVKTYSSGMVVRLAFAVQVMVPKEILIVDEALAVGDELFQRKCFAKIEEFKKHGGTVLFVSHSISTIIELCDRAILIDEGELLMIGNSKKVANIYQKLLFTSPNKRQEYRAEIKQIEGGTVDANGSHYEEDNTINSDLVEIEEIYDESLVIREKMIYENRGAEIFDCDILTIDCKKANILFSGQQYIWTYKVKFSKHCTNVRFGMLIKTLNGLELGGSTTANIGYGIPFVDSDKTVQVSFFFTPRLIPGTYFLNAGVLEFSDQEEIYIARSIDLAVFKIFPNEKSPLMTGTIDFNITSELKYD